MLLRYTGNADMDIFTFKIVAIGPLVNCTEWELAVLRVRGVCSLCFTLSRLCLLKQLMVGFFCNAYEEALYHPLHLAPSHLHTHTHARACAHNHA